MLKAYHDIEAWGNDEEWEEVVARAGKLYEAGKGSPHTEKLCKAFTMAILDYLETISKGKGDREACIAERMRKLEEEEAQKRGSKK